MDRFIILALSMITGILGSGAQSLTAVVVDDGGYFIEDGDSILIYQAKDKSLGGRYSRSNYIHPLYSLDGKILTEDFPSDHPHHRGIFWAWHQLYIGDKKIGDGWAIEDFHWDVKSVKLLRDRKMSKSIQAEVLWKSPNWLLGKEEKAMVREITTIRVYPKQTNYRSIDIEISLTALEPGVRLGGSEDEKGYGGFSPRIDLSEDVVFTGPDGIVQPHNLPVKAGRWLDISGSMGKNGAHAGMTILSHPSNPGFPNPWILRAKRSMQNAVYPYPGAQAVDLPEANPTTLRYRLLVHQGDSDSVDIDAIFTEYSQL